MQFGWPMFPLRSRADQADWGGKSMVFWLVVTGTMEFYDFPIQLGMLSSQLSHIFQRGRAQPPTSYDRIHLVLTKNGPV